MMKPKKILMVAGEASGDLYGANLAEALKKVYPEAKFFGVGGAGMKNAGVDIIFPIDELAIIGFTEVLPKLWVIKRLFQLLSRRIKTDRIDLAILINYPGFNLRFAKVLKKKGVPVVFYSSPQVWVWGRCRIKEIKKSVDKMIVFLRFEERLYKEYGVDAEFVGHPLLDIARPSGEDLGIMKNGKRIISLLPGSRKSEIQNNLPAMLTAARIISYEIKDVQFLLAKHAELPLEIYDKYLKKHSLPLKLIDGKTYDCLSISDLAIVVSGSVTLEAAILRTPMIITNRLSFLSALLFFIFVKLPYVGLVNIVRGRRIMPEILQYRATPKNLAREALSILSDPGRYAKMKEELELTRTLIGPSGAAARAAASICAISS